MDLRSFYSETGGDYETVLQRFRSEERILRYLKRFPEDSSYDSFERALQRGDAEEAFLAVHTLKGICLNLGLSDLMQSASVMTEMLRPLASGGDTSCGSSGIPAGSCKEREALRTQWEKVIRLLGRIE